MCSSRDLVRLSFLVHLQSRDLTLASLAVRIYFYMPENCLPPMEEREDWSKGEPSRLGHPGKASTAQHWIYLTFIRLSKAGVDVRLCHQMPGEGIVVALTGHLINGFRAPESIYLIGVVADGTPHPACHFHILQNAAHSRRLTRSAYIPHWPQPSLIPRHFARGERFENLVFYGDPPNLAPELKNPSFQRLLKNRLDLDFLIARLDRWHDYSETDCVLAIRTFGSKPFLRKPATKLYNAWMASVPMIGGADSAFQTDGRDGIDYMRCDTMESLWSGLTQFRDDPDFRNSMVAQGRQAAQQFTPESITERWRVLLDSLSIVRAPAYMGRHRTLRTVAHLAQHMSLLGDRLRGY